MDDDGTKILLLKTSSESHSSSVLRLLHDERLAQNLNYLILIFIILDKQIQATTTT